MPFALQKEEHALVEHREPLFNGHAVKRVGEGCGVERAVILDFPSQSMSMSASGPGQRHSGEPALRQPETSRSRRGSFGADPPPPVQYR
jgi:hypothetical protein